MSVTSFTRTRAGNQLAQPQFGGLASRWSKRSHRAHTSNPKAARNDQQKQAGRLRTWAQRLSPVDHRIANEWAGAADRFEAGVRY